MSKLNLLIISYSYPPSNAPSAQRPYALAKYLDKDKFNVTVLTCSNTDSSLGFDSEFDEHLEDVNLFKIKSKVGKSVSGLRNSKMADKKAGFSSKIKSKLFNLLSSIVVPDKAIFWYPNVVKFIKNNQELISKTDVVFSTSPAFSNHLIAKYVKNHFKHVKWIVDMRDFHYIESFSEKKSIKAKINKYLERSVLKKADKVTFISNSMKDIYANYYKKFEYKMNVIYNGFDLDDQKNSIVKPTDNEKITIFYAGSFYRGVRSPMPLFKILDELFRLNKLNKSDLVIKIAGNFEADLLEESKTYKSFECVEFLGKISRSEVLKLLNISDLLWLIIGEKPSHYAGVPIKFFEYLGARRHIINFAPSKSEPTRIINEYNLGWNFDIDNFDLSKNVVNFDKIITLYKSGELKKPLEEKSFNQFNRKHQGKIFEELFLN